MTERDIFLNLLDLPDSAARDSYLSHACGGNALLRGRVEALLRSHDHVGSFLSTPAVPRPSLAGESSRLPTGDDTANAGENAIAEALAFLTPSVRPDSLGRLGQYEILEVLGRGGFGIVFRAFDDLLQRVVAVKLLAPNMAATSAARKRFLREARGCAAVRHENVVQAYAVHEQPLPHLAMEFIPGETLQQRLDRTGPFETADVLRIGRQIAEGLAAAHKIGLIHRDIKPGNILLEANPIERVKISDFGLAQAADDASLSQSGIVAGTPMFMAPEQARGEPVDCRSDLFSLGSVLYALCTGRPPFRARSVFAVIKRVVDDEPRPIREVVPEVPEWLCDFIAKLQSKKPEDRFGSSAEVAELLARWQSDPPQPKAPKAADAPTDAPMKSAAARIARKRGWLLTLAASAALLAGLGLGEATGFSRLGGAIVRLFSPDGTLLVEIDDPEMSLSIEGEDVVITGAGVKKLRIKPGKYNLRASKDGALLYQQIVAVERNGRQVVRVGREPPLEIQAKLEPKGGPADRRAALWLRSVGPTRLEVTEGAPDTRKLIPPDQPLPAGKFRLVIAYFQGPQFEEMGEGLAEKLAIHLAGVRLEGAFLPRNLTTAGLAKVIALPEFSELTFLALQGNQLDDGMFPHVAKLRKLTNLDCNRAEKVTGKGIHVLKACPQLDSLTMFGSPLTSEAFEELPQLPSLRYFNATLTPMTEGHVAALTRTSIDNLVLARCGINDALAASLAGVSTLQRLQIPGNPLTDKGLAEFHKLKNLKELDIGGIEVSAAAVAKLQKALPDCKVKRE